VETSTIIKCTLNEVIGWCRRDRWKQVSSRNGALSVQDFSKVKENVIWCMTFADRTRILAKLAWLSFWLACLRLTVNNRTWAHLDHGSRHLAALRNRLLRGPWDGVQSPKWWQATLFAVFMYDCLIQIVSDMNLVDYLLTQRKVSERH